MESTTRSKYREPEQSSRSTNSKPLLMLMVCAMVLFSAQRVGRKGENPDSARSIAAVQEFEVKAKVVAHKTAPTITAMDAPPKLFRKIKTRRPGIDHRFSEQTNVKTPQ